MLKMQPIAITVEGESTYRVRFQAEDGQITEFTFEVDSSNGFDLVVSEMSFLEITNGDPAADRLKECIGVLHEARHFAYESEEASKTADISVSRSETDAAKKASA
jgi:hypothetical protein